MPVAKSSGGGDFTPVPVGNHPARCYGVISLGTQPGGQFPDAFKVLVMWEIPGETIERDGKRQPMSINREYTLSLSEKANLRKDLESWRGRPFTELELNGFEVKNVIDAPCLLNIIHKPRAKDGKMQAKVASVSPLPKGLAVPPLANPKLTYEVEDGRSEAFNRLPEWVRKKIEGCEEWIAPAHVDQAPPTTDEGDERVPF